MKIKINAHARASLTDDEYNFLKLLEIHETFSDEVVLLRKELNIECEEDGISLAPKQAVTDQKLLHEKTQVLLEKLGIPYAFETSITEIIDWGEVYSAKQPILVLGIDHMFIGDAKHIRKGLSDYGFLKRPYPEIHILKAISVPQIINEIKQREPEIEKEIEKFKNWMEENEIIKISSPNIEEDIKIYQLKNKPLTHQHVKKALEKDNIFLTREAVSQRYSRLKTVLKKLKFVTK